MEEKEKKDIHTLKVRMLGQFTIKYGGVFLLRDKNQSSRPMHLLQLLLYAGQEGVRRNRLTECLFGGSAQADLSNSLRVAVYSLRRILKKSGLPGEMDVVAKGGHYYFRSSFLVEVDALLFDHLYKEAQKLSGRARLEILKKACLLYRGYFLPELSGEEWVNVAEAHYQHQYFSCLNEVCSWLKEEEAYEELLRLSTQAASIYPLDEWQVWQMESLIALGRTKEALSLYERTAAMYFEDRSISPTERMLKCFRRMSGKIQMQAGDFREIQKRLREEAVSDGAYYCSYPSFVDSYRLFVRILEHSRQPASLLLCTLTDERKQNPDISRLLPRISKLLGEAIKSSLRQGDVYTRYSQNQYLVFLMDLPLDACQNVVGRIDACFRRMEKSRKVRVTYRIAQVGRELKQKNC